MRIQLILAASRGDPLRKNDPFMPLSLPILAATAPGHDYRLVDLLWEDEPDLEADLVGISARATGERRAYEIAAECRRRGIPVVLGGPQASAVPHRARRHVDAVAIGEGEDLWPQIVADAEARALRDFYVCSPGPFDPQGGSSFSVAPRKDLSGMPTPRRDLWSRKYRFDTVYAMRGCPIDCDFCSVTTLFGARYRARPVSEVVAEIDQFDSYYYLLDDTVFGRKSTWPYYVELYREIAGLGKTRYWTGQANVDAASHEGGREVIRAAARAGLLHAACGLESINPLTLRKSRALLKTGAPRAEWDEPIARMKDNIRYIQDQGIIVSGWFVLGYEDDDLDSFRRTADFCEELDVLPMIFPLRALPGTPLHARLRREGKLDESRILNHVHPTLREDEVQAVLTEIRGRAYGLFRRLSRSRFYASRFADDRIHKTIFSHVLQARIAGAMDLSRVEHFVEDGDA